MKLDEYLKRQRAALRRLELAALRRANQLGVDIDAQEHEWDAWLLRHKEAREADE